MPQNLQNIAKFQKFQLDNLVDFAKCCKTHIYLQKSVPIQPKTSNILPKFCQPAGATVDFATDAGPRRVAAKAVILAVPSYAAAAVRGAFFENAFFENAFFKNFANLWRARSRLYRSQILQVNTRWKALAEIYKMHSFATFSKLKFLFENR